MKRIVSVSIGSSARDKAVETEILGQKYHIERIGTDGSIRKAIEMISTLDGMVDAFGMGGIDLYLTSGSNKRYVIREAVPIRNAARRTPIVDGTGIKNTLEGKAIEYLHENRLIDLKNRKVLVTSAADRYRMAKAFSDYGSEVIIGDLIFALGIPVPIRKMATFRRMAEVFMPAIAKLPFKMLYPTGDEQKRINPERFSEFYRRADIIAGDFHYIKKYMPQNMHGKVIVTNTVTAEDVEMMRKRGVGMLVTTTPVWEGRSFGTNVIEALVVTAAGKNPDYLTEDEYYSMLEKMDFKPRVEYLNGMQS